MRRYKKEDIVQMMSQEEDLEESLDFKKIIIFFSVLITIIVGAYYVLKYFHKNPEFAGILSLHATSSLLGNSIPHSKSETANSKNFSSFPASQILNPQTQLEKLKKQVNNLNVNDIAKNSPQMQKLTKDLQSLEKLPSNKAKEVCMQICSNL